MQLGDLGRILLVVGILLAVAGGGLLLAGRLGVGRLPGDLRFGSGNLRVYVPLGTMLVVSLVLTVVLNLLLRR